MSSSTFFNFLWIFFNMNMICHFSFSSSTSSCIRIRWSSKCKANSMYTVIFIYTVIWQWKATIHSTLWSVCLVIIETFFQLLTRLFILVDTTNHSFRRGSRESSDPFHPLKHEGVLYPSQIFFLKGLFWSWKWKGSDLWAPLWTPRKSRWSHQLE